MKQTKGLLSVVMHLTPQDVAGLRQDFERGLLAAIVDDGMPQALQFRLVRVGVSWASFGLMRCSI